MLGFAYDPVAMGLVDTMFVGRIGAEAIGAVGLGAQIYYAISICAGCILLGMDTIIAQAHGASPGVLVGTNIFATSASKRGWLRIGSHTGSSL